MNIVDFSQATLFSFFLIFCRIGTPMMFIPAIGEAFVMMRVRVIFALMLSIMMTPVLSHFLPPFPTSYLMLLFLVAEEFLIGVILGLVIKLVMSALHTAGMVVAFMSGLASGMLFDPAQGSQGSIFGNFMAMLATVLIVTTNLHYAFFIGIMESYQTFPVSSLATHYDSYFYLIIRVAAESFNIGIKMATPFLVVGIVFYLGSGILSRLMPQLQIFFILLPVQIITSFTIFFLTISITMLWFMNHYKESINQFFIP